MLSQNPDFFQKTHWDVVIVGTGIGGATLGLAAAKSGLKVLFVEKGFLRNEKTIYGELTSERIRANAEDRSSRVNVKRRAGLWTDEIKSRNVSLALGCGAGGTSALYGMALERFQSIDFEGCETPQFQSARWPVDYREFLPYYRMAEQLYNVHGEAYDLAGDESSHIRNPEKLSEGNHELMRFLAKKNVHCYRLHLANKMNRKECGPCQGYLCAYDCKNDANNTCLEPAINHYGANILADCEAMRLVTDQDLVKELIVRHGDQSYNIRGSVYVLAAGAISTPLILLNSACDIWPYGVGNSSRLIGRNLMIHAVDHYSVETNSQNEKFGTKQIAFNDLYLYQGMKLGTFQSYGFRDFKRTTKLAFASILEDEASALNCVELLKRTPQKFLNGRITYKLNKSDRLRLDVFREQLQAIFYPMKLDMLSRAEKTLNTAHACGTCRFGSDPKTSVLDAGNRMHDLRNLYIADASFFPSSGGTNPALTIAANSLRISNHITKTAFERRPG